MADIDLSLQSLNEQLQTKADINHTHTFIGSIESALSLNGVTYDKFLRNDLKDQTIQSYYTSTSFGIASSNTKVRLIADNNRSFMTIGCSNLDTSNLTISGENNGDTVVKIIGELLVNDSRVLTLNNKNEITGVDLSSLDNVGCGILVEAEEPTSTINGTIWGEILDADLIASQDSPVGTSQLYTVPVGSIIKTLSLTIPNGYVALNGQILSRNGYAGLWNFAKAKAPLVSEVAWQTAYSTNNVVESYSYGDGSTTFRIPNIVTGDSTIYIIKAYDDLSIKESLNISEIQSNIDSLLSSKSITGIGYIKYNDGTLIQYGSSVQNGSLQNVCSFSISFINTDYSIIGMYEGTDSGIVITNDKTNKLATKCNLFARSIDGKSTTGISVNYLAIGRWE